MLMTFQRRVLNTCPNKSTNEMQQLPKFITWRLRTAQHVSGVLTLIIRSSTTAVAASGFTFGAWWQQCSVYLTITVHHQVHRDFLITLYD